MRKFYLFLGLVLFLVSIGCGMLQTDYVWDIWDFGFMGSWVCIFGLIGFFDL